MEIKDQIASQMVERIAKVCHEVNRAYCASLGDHTQAPWNMATEGTRASARSGVLAHLMNKDLTPESSHGIWLHHKKIAGWVYGERKDEIAKTHPCMIPYEQLPPEQKAKDYIFKSVVDSVREIVGI